MLECSELVSPRIDLEMYGGNTSIEPIKQVQIMNEDEFERFITEWLCGCKKSSYATVLRIGGAGDKGRDVIARNIDGSLDVYQCKHYESPLAPSQFYVELGKLCYYTYKVEIPVPKHYYIIASHGIGPKLATILENSKSIASNLIQNWGSCCQDKISKAQKIVLDDALMNYIESFDFSIVEYYPIENIIDEHLNTVYGTLRFGGRQIQKPDAIQPPEFQEKNEMAYIKALMDVYSEKAGRKITDLAELKKFSRWYEHFTRQRKDYYAAETVRRFVRDTLTNSNQFSVLEDEIYDGIVDVYEMGYASGFDRLNGVLAQAVQVNTTKSLLDRKLNYIGNKERKGICHMLTEKKGLKWVNNDDGDF